MGLVTLDKNSIDAINAQLQAALGAQGTVRNGAKQNINPAGNVALATAGSGLTLEAGLIVKASGDNPAGQYLYVGAAGVTATNGYELGAGDSVAIPANDVSLVSVTPSTSGLDLSWIGV